MELIERGTNLYCVEQPFQLIRVHIGLRMTVIKLSDGSLWVHSPISPHQDLVDHMNQLGPTRYVIAPNMFHHIHLPNFHEHFAEAKFYAVPGLKHKRAGFPFDEELSEQEEYPWASDIESLMVHGMPKVNEWVFLHKSSKTLILTDMLMNLNHTPNFASKLFAKLNKVKDGPNVTWFYNLNISDTLSFKASVDKILAWDFDRIIMSHGQVVEKNGKEIFRNAVTKVVG